MWGIPLKPSDFKYWSDVIGSFYKPLLKLWYMETARYSQKAIPVAGSTLISVGYKECVKV